MVNRPLTAAGVPATPIRLTNHARPWSVATYGHKQGVQHQPTVHTASHRSANNDAGI